MESPFVGVRFIDIDDKSTQSDGPVPCRTESLPEQGDEIRVQAKLGDRLVRVVSVTARQAPPVEGADYLIYYKMQPA